MKKFKGLMFNNKVFLKKLFLIIFIVFLLTSFSLSFKKFIIDNDFYYMAFVDCNPGSESCFATEFCEEEYCSDYFYKILHKKAFSVNSCNQYEIGSCKQLDCLPSDNNCFYTLCDEELNEQCF